jgi:hypothetical protein
MRVRWVRVSVKSGLQGAGSSERMLLVTGCARLVTVKSDGEVDGHSQLLVERYARGKSRSCVLCMHDHDEPSNDSATTKLPQLKSHNSPICQDPDCINYQGRLQFCPSFVPLLHFICQILFLRIFPVRVYSISNTSHGFIFSTCPILCIKMPVSSHLYLDTRHDASSRSNSKAEA